jgi:chaperonin GroES
MQMRPLHDRIIVQRVEESTESAGSIVIPDSAKDKPQQGRVIAAGSGRYTDEGTRVPLDVKAGDIILFGKYSGHEIKLEGQEYLVMREDDVLAALNGGRLAKKAAARAGAAKRRESARTPLDGAHDG